MEVDEALLESVRSVVSIGDHERPLVCTNATHFSKHNKKIKAIMLFTDFCFYIIEKSAFSKSGTIAGQARWNEMTEIKYYDKTTFSISNNNVCIKVGHQMAEYFLKLIISHIKNILIPSEMPKFVNLDSILSTVEHSREAFIKRFAFQIRLSNGDYPSKLIKELSKIICRVSELDIPSLPSADKYTDILLNCCQIEPTIRSVIIPQSLRDSYWPSLANCLRLNSTLVHIKTNDVVTSDFSRVVEALEKNSNTYVSKYTFVKANLNSEHFPLLQKMLDAVPFTELCFDRAISGPDFLNLLDFENIPFSMTSLKSLTFKGTKDLPLTDIFSAIRSLKELIFIDCSINVDTVFKLLPKSNLETIKIVGGKMNETLSPSIKLPPSLCSISFDKVRWTIGAFDSAWKICIGHQTNNKKLSLSFSTVTIASEQWSTFFANMKSQRCPDLVELNWSENPFEPQILHFMMKCEKLRTIIADGCFSPQCPSIQDFIDFLNASKRINILSIRGTEKCRIQGAAELIFDGLHKNKKLREIDVSDNDFGSAGILALAELLVANKKIKKVRFSDNNIETGEAFYKFFDEVKERGPKLDMIYPDKEIHRMHKAQLIDAKSVNYMQDCYAIILSGNLKVKSEDTRSNQNDSDDEGENGNLFGGLDDIQPPDPINEESNFDIQIQQNSEVFDMKTQWVLNLPDIPPPNINTQMDAIARTYNTPLLISRARSV